MPVFHYKAVSPDGELHEGEMETSDTGAVISQLKSANLIPILAEPAEKFGNSLNFDRLLSRRRSIDQTEVNMFTHELAVLLCSGLPLDRSLKMLVNLFEGEKLGLLAQNINEIIQSGKPFSAALEAQAGIFSSFYISMVQAGEASGNIEKVLTQLADYLEQARNTRQTILSAMIYPGILVTVATLSILLLMIFVVPQFAELFRGADQKLPLITRVVIGTADFLASYWWALLLAGISATALARAYLRSEKGRYKRDMHVLRLPVVGELVRKVETARMSRAMGTMLENGVPLLDALSISRNTLSNHVIADAMELAKDSLKNGGGFALPLMPTKLFPKQALQLLKVGEDAGQLDTMFLRVADIFDQEVREAIQRLLSLLEPALIVFLGVTIAGIIMSILAAILSVNQLAF